MTYSFEDYYKVLNVPFHASQAEIKQAYKQQAKKNHPDMGGNEDEFIKVQKAYEILRNLEKKRFYDNVYQKHYREQENRGPAYKQYHQTNAGESHKRSEWDNRNNKETSRNQKQHPTLGPFKRWRIVTRTFAIILVLYLIFLRFGMNAVDTLTIAEDESLDNLITSEGNEESYQSNTEETQIENPTYSNIEDTDLEEDTDLKEENTDLEEENTDLEEENEEIVQDEIEVETIAEKKDIQIPPGYFSIGSTQEAVKSVMGPPTSIIGGSWDYEYSIVRFDSNARVNGWSDISGNLKTYMGESVQNTTLTLGSTMEEVVDAMGTPTAILMNTWEYEYSIVRFDSSNKVVGWSDISDNLNVYMGHKKENQWFTVGSSKQDVINAMGTPTAIHMDTWEYEYSIVRFDFEGKVSEWSDISGNLNVK